MLLLPIAVYLIFIICVLLCLLISYQSLSLKKEHLILFLVWMAGQSYLAVDGFYQNFDGLPPRVLLVIVPTILFIGIVFSLKSGRVIIKNMDLRMAHWLHVLRVPIELVLYWLFAYSYIPEIMTFMGENFDILMGLSAIPIILLCFKGNNIQHPKILLVWNVVGILLLLHIIYLSAFSFPTSLQKFGLNQPNLAMVNIPFILLPAFIVPMVLFMHIASIYRLGLMLKRAK